MLQGKLGPEAAYEIKFEKNAFLIEIKYDGSLLDGGLILKIDAESILQALKIAIKGDIDDKIIDLIISAVKK